MSKLLRNSDKKNRRDQVEGLSHMCPKFVWKEVTLLIVGWFTDLAWNDNEKWYEELLKVLCNFYSIYVIYQCDRGLHSADWTTACLRPVV